MKTRRTLASCGRKKHIVTSGVVEILKVDRSAVPQARTAVGPCAPLVHLSQQWCSRAACFLLALLIPLVAQAKPTITSLSPASGAVGSLGTISGSGFGSTQSSSTVKFNGKTATVTSWSANSITATVATGTTTGNVVVTVGGVASSGVTFTVTPAPSNGSLTPNIGAVGSSIVIAGSNFGASQGNGNVKFNGTLAAITSWSATSITATLATGTTTGNVIVTAAGGVASNGVNFTVTLAPSISSLTPNTGAVGASVVLAGSNFGPAQGNGKVTFSSNKTATITSWSATSITATVPAGAVTGNVVVTAAGGVQSAGSSFTVVAAPSITSLAPATAAWGTSVTITGINFGATQGSNSTVKFSGTVATPTSWSATTIQVPVPANASSGNVVVHAGGVDSNGSSFTVAPGITSLSPTSGVVGTSVTITGTSFGSSQGASTVKFNGTKATVISWSATSIIATVPSGATTGNVVVTTSVASNGAAFTVVSPPSISSLSPMSGGVGAAVTINGSNFGATQGGSQVTFSNNATATTINSWSNTKIVALVPAGAITGNVTVTVGGNTSNGASFTVIQPPSISNLSPFSAGIGTSITINGSNFGATQGGSMVTFFNNIAATTINSWSATSINVQVPTGATSGNVTVTTAGGSSSANFTVIPAPVLSNVSPASAGAGALVTITGSNFGATQGASLVNINNANAPVVSWSATTIVVSVPATAVSGSGYISVTTAGGMNYLSFTVVPTSIISSLSTTSGGVGAQFTITGSSFGATQGNSNVIFNNNVVANTIVSWADTSITLLVPSVAITGNIVVATAGGPSNGVNFTVLPPPPNVTGLSPTTGPVGTAVTISGNSFGATQGSSSTVTFNNNVVATPSSWSDTSIVVNVPTGASSGYVTVANAGGSSYAYFTVIPAPGISSLSPTSGVTGTRVTITGTSFGASQGSSTVTFNNNIAATPSSWSDTSIVVPVPAGATTGNLTVTTTGGPSSATFTVFQSPNISSLSTSVGAVGTSVTITGTNFGASQSASTVSFNGAPGSPTSWSATSIVVPVPTGATTGNLVLEVCGEVASCLVSNDVIFTVVAHYISGVSPTSGILGTAVTITGSGFGATQGNSFVTFNGLGAVPVSWSDTSIVAQVPVGNATGNVVATVNAQASNGVSFTGVGPSIASIFPTSGPVGASITITGSHFGATACNGGGPGCAFVTFNGLAATVSSWSDTSIVVQVPVGNTTGNVVVTISNSTTQANANQVSNGVPFTGVPPSITSIFPTSGPVGASITITGSHFGTMSGCNGSNYYSCSVSFNGLGAVPVSWSDTSIVAQVPVGNTTGNVVVTISNGASQPYSSQASNGVPFTGQTPTIGSLSPISGLVGASVTITGSYFGASPGTVTFNGYAGSVLSWSNTSIVVSVPSSATTGNVIVTAGNQPSNSAIFTVLPPVIASVSPTSGGVGLPITITGSNFGPSQGTTTLTFNGTPASVTSWTQTSIVTAVPVATTGNVVVTENGQASNAVNFTVLAPTIASLSPNSGSTGTLVTVAGSNFGPAQGSSNLTFNGTVVAPKSWSAGNITAVLPAGITTGNVVVSVGSQTSNAILFTVGAPTITSLSFPSGGPGTAITINGANFGANQGTSTVSFNGTPATPTAWTSDSIVTVVPATATTGNVVVTVAGQASNGVGFTITTAPGISSITPALGAVGTSVTTTGSNFGATPGSVTFNGTPANPTSWNASSIVVPVPTGATTGPVVVTAGSQASNGVTFDVSTNVISYAYDDVGRLVGVVDPTGNSATYSYDAVGNILSISRQAVGQVVIFSFSPSSGLAGSSTTIQGSGFSPVAGQNTVQFDGVSATITSASPTQLIATVPNGAGTGPITVTSPAGAATSSTNFTVLNGLVPVITSFTPGIVVGNAMVTVTGNNFDLNPANDLTTFNVTRQFQQTVTATSISAAVPPNTGSGHITVATPAGQAVSSQDLYIVPYAGYTAAAIGFTGRINSGGSQTISFPFPSSDGFALLLFDGVAGQTATVTSNPNPANSACQITLLSPTNGSLGSTTYCYQSLNGIVLPSTGTFTIAVEHNEGWGTGGSTTVGLNLTPPALSGTIQPGGPPVTVNIPTAGQAAQLVFHGSLNQKISISVSSAAFTSYSLIVQDPTGNSGMGSSNFSGGQSAYVDTVTLTIPGKYTLVITPGSTGVTIGNITLQINNDADANGTIVPDGPPATVTTTVPGKDTRLAFTGAAGQRVALNITNVTTPQALVNLLNPDGSYAAYTAISSGGPFFLDTTTLPAAGTYTVWVQHSGANLGSETLQLANSPADLVAYISPGGSAVTTNGTVPLQDVRLLFTGTAGRNVSLLVSNVTNPSATVAILNPDGTTLRSTAINNTGGPFFIGSSQLPATGVYTVWIKHSGSNTGAVTAQLYDSTDITGPIAPSGPAVTETTVPGQDVRLTFNGTAGKRISLMLINVINPIYTSVSVLNPDGSTLENNCPFVCSFFLNAQTLSATGTYTIWVHHSGTSNNGETVQLYDASDVTGAMTAGQAVTVTTVPGQDARLTFTGTAGQRISLTASNVTNPSAVINVLDPAGNRWNYLAISNHSGTSTLGPGDLTLTGTYTVWVQHSGSNAGSETLQLNIVPPQVTGTLSVNGGPLTISLINNQTASLTFNTTGSYEAVTLQVTNNTVGSVNLWVIGYPSTSVTSSATNFFSPPRQNLGAGTGPYTISINPSWGSGANPGSITVAVTSP
jgi:YD repeat-containing protein